MSRRADDTLPALGAVPRGKGSGAWIKYETLAQLQNTDQLCQDETLLLKFYIYGV